MNSNLTIRLIDEMNFVLKPFLDPQNSIVGQIFQNIPDLPRSVKIEFDPHVSANSILTPVKMKLTTMRSTSCSREIKPFQIVPI